MPKLEPVPFNAPAALVEMQDMQRGIMKDICALTGIHGQKLSAPVVAPLLSEYRALLQSWKAAHRNPRNRLDKLDIHARSNGDGH